MGRRQMHPSSIYESVKEPYAYTSGFHNLTAFIQRRFTPQKTDAVTWRCPFGTRLLDFGAGAILLNGPSSNAAVGM
jgi:hypothetical protein